MIDAKAVRLNQALTVGWQHQHWHYWSQNYIKEHIEDAAVQRP